MPDAGAPAGQGYGVSMGASSESQDGELHRVTIESAPNPLIVVAEDGRIVLANQRARAMFGAQGAEATLVGLDVDELLPDSLRSAHQAHRGRYARHPRARPMGSGLELLGRRFDGSELPVEVSLSPIRAGGRHFVIASILDLTERRAAEASLRSTQERLALVGERERIGRDLHDSVIQRLYGVGLAMQSALDRDPDHLRRIAADAVGEIDDTITEIRDVIRDLTRHKTETGHLGDRLAAVVEEQAANLDTEVTLHIVGRPGSGVPARVADAVVAVVRECVANAHRHGRAAEVVVDFDLGVDDKLRVVVSDDGVGFDPSQPGDGYGLDNLRARAEALGGSFVVDSAPGAGTRVVWEIPAGVRSGAGDGSRNAPGTFYPVEFG